MTPLYNPIFFPGILHKKWQTLKVGKVSGVFFFRDDYTVLFNATFWSWPTESPWHLPTAPTTWAVLPPPWSSMDVRSCWTATLISATAKGLDWLTCTLLFQSRCFLILLYWLKLMVCFHSFVLIGCFWNNPFWGRNQTLLLSATTTINCGGISPISVETIIVGGFPQFQPIL